LIFNVTNTGGSGPDLTDDRGISDYSASYSGSGVVKTGSGSLSLSGYCTYAGPTTVSNGTLLVDGSLGGSSTVTVQSGGTLAGVGTVNGPIFLQSGATLAAGDSSLLGTLTLASSSVTFNAGSINFLRISKTGGSLASDEISDTTAPLNFAGTLVVSNVTSDSTTLAVGDSFTLFPGGGSGGFANIILPRLSSGLSWDTSQLLTAGLISVLNTAATPSFNPAGGGYAGAQTVKISSVTAGAAIYYTTNGSTPTGSSPHGTSPVTVVVPVNASHFTITAFTRASGFSDSPMNSASYWTVVTPTWTNSLSDSWANSNNWLNTVIGSGSGVTADLSELTMNGNITVTLDTPQTIGSLLFADRGNTYGWTLSTGAGGTLTLNAGTNSPIVSNSAPVTISVVIAGINGFTKYGSNILTLSGNNTYTGPVTVNAGTLDLEYNYGTGNTRPAIVVNPGASLNSGYRGVATYEPVTLNGTTWTNGGGYYSSTLNLLNGANVTGSPMYAAYYYGSTEIQSGGNLPSTYSANITLVHYSGYNYAVDFIVTNTGGTGPDLTFNGAVSDYSSGYAGAKITKKQSGTLLLSGANTYSGPTVVYAGTLLVNGSLGTNLVTVTNSTLGGNGIIGGSVLLTNGATLSPSASSSSFCTLTINKALTMANSSTNTFKVNGSTPANDSIALGGTVTYGGTLNIISSGTFTSGQTFTLFSGSGAVTSSSFANLVSSSSGVQFSFANGILTVVGVGPSGAAKLTNSITGNILSLSWPAGQGWRLECETNSLTAGLGTNWVPVAGASASGTNITVNPSVPAAFYRLIYP
jgi:autotransporter-associated beta strand protein